MRYRFFVSLSQTKEGIDFSIPHKMNITTRTRLLNVSCRNASTTAVKELLNENHPSLDVNGLLDGSTPLHKSCNIATIEITKLLLAHPNINVNVNARDATGHTPLRWAFFEGLKETASLLIKDPRVEVSGISIQSLVSTDQLSILKEMLMRRLDLDINENITGDREEFLGDYRWSDNQQVRGIRLEAWKWITYYKNDRYLTQRFLLQEAGEFEGYKSKQLFVLSILIEHGYYTISESQKITPAGRFFSIMSQLPTELKMKMVSNKTRFISSQEIALESRLLQEEGFFV